MIDIGKQLNEFTRSKRRLVQNIGNNGVKMFKLNNFNAQGFIDSGVNRWIPKKKKDGRKTLVGKTGNLRNTINYTATTKRIKFGTLTPYGKRHNEGLNGMPKRQFMGDSTALNALNKSAILKYIKNIMG